MLRTDPRVHDSERQGSGSVSGETFAGRWRALAEIGHGSTGRLFLARDVESGERVVVKRALDADLLRNEADVLRTLAHPGVVRLKERHDAASPPFLLLELVEGTDLEAFLGQHGGTLDALTLGRLLLRLCDAVAFVHDRGFLHRDLKPANVLVRPDGSPVLVDFGAALPLKQAGAASLWSFVTEGYAAPEQYFTDRREGPWTDVYGLGALGHRALAGSAPAAALIRAGGARGEPLAAVRDGALALREAIDWALEPEAADRPQSVAAWRERLVAAIEQAEQAAAPPRSQQAAGRAEAGQEDYPPTIRVARARAGNPAPRAAEGQRETVPAEPRRARVLPLVLVLAALAAAGVAVGVYGWPLYERYVKTEWLVDQAGGGDATTIAGALARARDGAVIRIGPGTYAESLRIERPVTLIALEGATPVLAPESGPCALVTSPTGAIAGLDLRGAPAVEGEASAPCVILAGTALTLGGNRIAGGAGPGILIRDGAEPVVRGNRLEGTGLVVSAGGRGTITGNSIVDAPGASLVVRGGADPSLGDNLIEGGGGVVFAEGALGTLTGNRLLRAGATAIRVTTGARPRIEGNTIEGAKEAGIFVYDGGGGRIEGNTIAGSGLSGVVIAGGGTPEVVANTIRGNAEHGVLVVEGGRALLEGNQITGNEGHGIALGADSEVEMTDNRLEGNDEPQLVDAR
jgi:parallel beta-helix repeat protein